MVTPVIAVVILVVPALYLWGLTALYVLVRKPRERKVEDYLDLEAFEGR